MFFNSLIFKGLFMQSHVLSNNIEYYKGWTHIRPATSGFALYGKAFRFLISQKQKFYHQDRIAMRIAARLGFTYEYNCLRTKIL